MKIWQMPLDAIHYPSFIANRISLLFNVAKNLFLSVPCGNVMQFWTIKCEKTWNFWESFIPFTGISPSLLFTSSWLECGSDVWCWVATLWLCEKRQDKGLELTLPIAYVSLRCEKNKIITHLSYSLMNISDKWESYFLQKMMVYD